MAFINTLYNLWPNGDEKIPGLRDGMAASAQAVFQKYGIDSSSVFQITPVKNTTTIVMFSSGNAPLTNANLSGITMSFQCIYPAT